MDLAARQRERAPVFTLQRPRLSEIDILVTVSFIGVMLIHTTAPVVSSAAREGLEYLAFFSINKLCSFSVPCFFFISGFKYTLKYRADGAPKSFFWARSKRIIIAYLIWNAIYYAYYIKYLGYKFSLSYFLKGTALSTVVSPFYFLLVILQLYLLFPLLLKLAAKVGPWRICLCALAVNIVFKQFIRFHMDDRAFTSYIFYFVLGITAAFIFEDRKKQNYLKWGALSLLLWALFSPLHIDKSLQMYNGIRFYPQSELWQMLYCFLSIAALSWLAAVLVRFLPSLSRLFITLSDASFYVYLSHALALYITKDHLWPLIGVTVPERMAVLDTAFLMAVLVPLCVLWGKTIHKRFKHNRGRFD